MKILMFLISFNLYAGLSLSGGPSGSGGGGISGPLSSGDNQIPSFSGTDGDTLQNITNGPIITASGNVRYNSTSGGPSECTFGSSLSGNCVGFVYNASTFDHYFNTIRIWATIASGMYMYTRFYLAPATCGSPSMGFSNDTNTGICTTGADSMGITTGGVARIYSDNANTEISNQAYFSDTENPIYKSPDNSCSRCGPDNSDEFSCVSVTCP